MRIRISPRAYRDLADIRTWLLKHSPTGAENVRLAITATLDHLAEFPRLGRSRMDLQCRMISVPRYDYTIYYRVRSNDIEVLHIRDERRRPLEAGEV